MNSNCIRFVDKIGNIFGLEFLGVMVVDIYVLQNICRMICILDIEVNGLGNIIFRGFFVYKKDELIEKRGEDKV